MLAKSIDGYFYFGTCVRYLQDIRTGFSIHSPGYVIDNLNNLFHHLDNLNLQVTKRAAKELYSFRNTLLATDKDAHLTAEQAELLNTYMNDLRKTLVAELEGFEAYVITPKRIDSTKLIDNVDDLF
ncbi:MAG: hypothetical protein GY721_10080, partial [Deltaproteobacteria bacterium]|nr:hypothetical protein [Deltaproteobacteria bacterium]